MSKEQTTNEAKAPKITIASIARAAFNANLTKLKEGGFGVAANGDRPYYHFRQQVITDTVEGAAEQLDKEVTRANAATAFNKNKEAAVEADITLLTSKILVRDPKVEKPAKNVKVTEEQEEKLAETEVDVDLEAAQDADEAAAE